MVSVREGMMGGDKKTFNGTALAGLEEEAACMALEKVKRLGVGVGGVDVWSAVARL